MEAQHMVSSPNGTGKRARTRKPSVSHERATLQRVYERMDDQDRKLNHLTQQVDLYIGVMQRVESKIDKMAKTVGDEEEDGNGGYIGTGLVGRTRRVEVRQTKLDTRYKQWISWGAGFCTAMAAMVAIIWWLISDKLELVLR